jgi:hypothetical protein
MTDSLGLELINELNKNPVKFEQQGKSYDLLQQYFSGFSIETLRPLLNNCDYSIKRVAIWIASELGSNGSLLVNDILPLINESDRHIKYHVLEIIAMCAIDKNLNLFIHIVQNLESDDNVIRTLSMRLLSNANESQLNACVKYFHTKRAYNKLHIEGLSYLLKIDQLYPEQVMTLINNNDALTRKYGIIAAKKLLLSIQN